MPKVSRSRKAKARRGSVPALNTVGYDDPDFDFRTFWRDREYEHAAEEMAIRRLLGRQHVKLAVDVGGGYGRLSKLLRHYADRVVLAEPSRRQLARAKEYLQGETQIERRQMPASKLTFGDGSVDLLLMVRVLSHIAYPGAEFAEIARVLTDDGMAVIEVANHAHMLNRLKYGLSGRRLPNKVVSVTPSRVVRRRGFQLLSHNPEAVGRQLEHARLRIVRTLSVSNLRSPFLKQTMPLKLLLLVERYTQVPLAGLLFGPSIFFLVKKIRT